MKVVKLPNKGFAGHPIPGKKKKPKKPQLMSDRPAIPVPAPQLKPSTRKEERPPRPTSITYSDKVAFAKDLQDNPTKSEQIVREYLQSKRYEFLFNEIVCGYIPDFYFPKLKTILELDGKFHDREADRKRDDNFRKAGIKTVRIKSQMVFVDFAKVVEIIEREVIAGKPKKKRKKKKGKKKLKGRKPTPEQIAECPFDDSQVAFMLATDGL